MKDGLEMFVCSWMTSSAIILQDEKQNKPTLTTDQSGIKGKHFFSWLRWLSWLSLSTHHQTSLQSRYMLPLFARWPGQKKETFYKTGRTQWTHRWNGQSVCNLQSSPLQGDTTGSDCLCYVAFGLDQHVSEECLSGIKSWNDGSHPCFFT